MHRGERLVEVLKQRPNEPLATGKQIAILHAVTQGRLDGYAVGDIGRYEQELSEFLQRRHSVLLASVAEQHQTDDQIAKTLNRALDEFAATFARTTTVAAAA